MKARSRVVIRINKISINRMGLLFSLRYVFLAKIMRNVVHAVNPTKAVLRESILKVAVTQDGEVRGE